MQAPRAHITVIGALAYDQICTTDTSLVAPGAVLLNRKLQAIHEAFGGCGGNIAYNFAQLRQPVQLISTSGALDDHRYHQHLEAHHIATDGCLRTDDAYSARAVIFTDTAGHQFTGFFPGPIPTEAQWQHHLRAADVGRSRLVIQAPYPPALMLTSLRHVHTLADAPLCVFLPGQYADQLSPSQAKSLLPLAHWVVGNRHEIEALERHQALAAQVVVQTDGARPVTIRRPGHAPLEVAIPPAARILDPTGCGDAFVAGLCHFLLDSITSIGDADGRVQDTTLLEQAVRFASRAAAACLACQGAQQHRLNALS